MAGSGTGHIYPTSHAWHTVAAQYKFVDCITDLQTTDIEGLIHTCRSDCVPGLGHPRVSRVSAVCGGAVPPVGEDGYPPALHLAEASVRELDVQGQLGDPDCHFQGGSEDVVAKGDPGINGPKYRAEKLKLNSERAAWRRWPFR